MLMDHPGLMYWSQVSDEFVSKIAENITGRAKQEDNTLLVSSLNIIDLILNSKKYEIFTVHIYVFSELCSLVHMCFLIFANDLFGQQTTVVVVMAICSIRYISAIHSRLLLCQLIVSFKFAKL